MNLIHKIALVVWLGIFAGLAVISIALFAHYAEKFFAGFDIVLILTAFGWAAFCSLCVAGFIKLAIKLETLNRS